MSSLATDLTVYAEMLFFFCKVQLTFFITFSTKIQSYSKLCVNITYRSYSVRNNSCYIYTAEILNICWLTEKTMTKNSEHKHSMYFNKLLFVSRENM